MIQKISDLRLHQLALNSLQKRLALAQLQPQRLRCQRTALQFERGDFGRR